MTSPRPEKAGAEEQPVHAPELGRMRRWLGSFHVTGVFWYRFHRWGVTILPSWAVGIFIALFTTFFFVALRRIRAAITSNLKVVLGPAGWWERQARIYRTFWNFAWCLSERYEILSTDRRVEAQIEGEELWRENREGLILTTAHVGHWEVGSMLAPSHEKRHVHVVREEEMDPAAQSFLRELFEQQGETNFTFHFAHDDPMLGLKMLASLRRGDIVAMQSDRPRQHGRTVPARLFGRPFAVPEGLVAMAWAAGVAMLPVFIFRCGRQRSRVVFRPLIRVARSGDRQQDFAAAAQRLADEVEWAIRQQPYQWFCFRALWPEAA